MKRQGHEHHNQMLIILGILALLIGALLWILNIMSIIAGPWAAILGVIFTAMSAIFGLLQWQTQSTTEAMPHHSDSFALQQTLSASLNGITLGMNKRNGALIIKTKKKYLGTTLHLCRGIGITPLATEMVSNIMERKIGSSSMFIGVFPKLEPGNYTVYLHNPAKGTPVTIYANQLSEIDRRYKELEDERP
jgi:hypothetical protein